MSFEKEEHEKLLLLFSDYKNAYHDSKNYILTYPNIDIHKAKQLLLQLLDDLRVAQLENIHPHEFFKQDQKAYTDRMLLNASIHEDINKYYPYIYGSILVAAYILFYGVIETYIQLIHKQYNKTYIIPFIIAGMIVCILIYVAAIINKYNATKYAFKPKKHITLGNFLPYLIYGFIPIIMNEFKQSVHFGPKQFIPWYIYWLIFILLIMMIKYLVKPFRKYYKQKSSPN